MIKKETNKIRSMVRKLKIIEAAIAKDRDKLQEIMEEAQDILDGSDEVKYDLNRAIDALSLYL